MSVMLLQITDTLNYFYFNIQIYLLLPPPEKALKLGSYIPLSTMRLFTSILKQILSLVSIFD